VLAFCCCDKIADKNNLKEKRLARQSIMVEGHGDKAAHLM
jgi:hypothetical protein